MVLQQGSISREVSGWLSARTNTHYIALVPCFLQKTLPEGKDYCERKIQFLKANHDKLVEVSLSTQFRIHAVVGVWHKR